MRARPHQVTATLLIASLLCALGWGLAAAKPDPFAAYAVQRTPFTSLSYAFHTSLWWNPFDGFHLDLVRLARFGHVKQVFAWADVQPGPDLWNWERADAIVALVRARDLALVVRLSDAPDWAYPPNPDAPPGLVDAPPSDPATFAAYCGAVAARYAGQVAAYQVWNEPNLAREWGGAAPDAAAYVRLLAACSAAIRAADPAAIVISAGLAPTGTHDTTATPDDVYLHAMYGAGFARHVDVVGMHAPGFSTPSYGPDDATRDGVGRWATFRRIEDLRAIMIAHGDAGRQVAILEMGWTTDPGFDPAYAWFRVDEATQAQHLVEAYAYAAAHWRPWVGLMTTIYMADPAWTEQDEQYWWSVVRPYVEVQPAYIDLANMAKVCGDRVIPARAPDSPEAGGLVPTDPCG